MDDCTEPQVQWVPGSNDLSFLVKYIAAALELDGAQPFRGQRLDPIDEQGLALPKLRELQLQTNLVRQHC